MSRMVIVHFLLMGTSNNAPHADRRIVGKAISLMAAATAYPSINDYRYLKSTKEPIKMIHEDGGLLAFEFENIKTSKSIH